MVASLLSAMSCREVQRDAQTACCARAHNAQWQCSAIAATTEGVMFVSQANRDKNEHNNAAANSV